ncbi:4Fe-4S cluster-binding domain-containing protein [Streptomyces sp. LZ34]
MDNAPGCREPVLRISQTHFPVETLGPGRRLGIWLQGCGLACPGCMSRNTWDPRGGTVRPVSSLLALWRAALARGADGLTVSGGEPLDQPAGLLALLGGAAEARAEAVAAGGPAAGREIDFLLYTGYEEREVEHDAARSAAVRHADVVVTGRFQAAEPTELVWRGSANQRMLPRTALGRARYQAHLARTAGGPRLQVVEGEGDVRLYGVPRRGELAALERGLRRSGIRLTGVSWRP